MTMPARRSVAYPPTDSRALLESLLSSSTYPTILLVCSSQATFVRDLLRSSELQSSAPAQALLMPTIHALSIAPHISVVFTPTPSHLRAWLAVADRSAFAPKPQAPPSDNQSLNDNKMAETKTGKNRGRLVTWNLIGLGLHTSEWSVQGLSETLSALVDCGLRLNCDIELGEATERVAGRNDYERDAGEDLDELMRDIVAGEGGEDFSEGVERATPDAWCPPTDIYQRRLPMLNGSSRRPGLDDSAAWSGRTVEVGVVLGRWFEFCESMM